MDYATIISTKSDKVMTIKLNRPEKHNAVNKTLCDELYDCLVRCDEEDEVRAIILTGNGKTFCSGGEIETEESHGDLQTVYINKLFRAAIPAFLELRSVGKPVIAAVNGAAVG